MPTMTIYTLAKELNMTPSMVSRAFNPEAKISEEKRQIVLAAAKKYDFSPTAWHPASLCGLCASAFC